MNRNGSSGIGVYAGQGNHIVAGVAHHLVVPFAAVMAHSRPVAAVGIAEDHSVLGGGALRSDIGEGGVQSASPCAFHAGQAHIGFVRLSVAVAGTGSYLAQSLAAHQLGGNALTVHFLIPVPTTGIGSAANRHILESDGCTNTAIGSATNTHLASRVFQRIKGLIGDGIASLLTGCDVLHRNR